MQPLRALVILRDGLTGYAFKVSASVVIAVEPTDLCRRSNNQPIMAVAKPAIISTPKSVVVCAPTTNTSMIVAMANIMATALPFHCITFVSDIGIADPPSGLCEFKESIAESLAAEVLRMAIE